MKVQYKDIYGNWHLGNNETISEMEIKIDFRATHVEWDGDNCIIKFKELEK